MNAPSSSLRCIAALALSLPVAAQGVRSRHDHGDSTAHEQLMLELINRARANPAAEAARLGIGLNDGLDAGTISTAAKPPLAFDRRLIEAARAHTRWMLDSGNFSHTGAAGSSAKDRMSAAGYGFSGGWSCGENISWGGTSGTPDLLPETIARHDGLFRSAGHRTNLCSTNNRDVGLGVLSGRFQGWNAVMATQTFAASGAQPHRFVTGVVFDDRDGDGFYDPGEGLAGVTVVPEGGAWEAVTSTSGGYAVPYAGTTGTLAVSFSGGPLTRVERRSIARTGSHVKLDLIPPDFVAVVPGSAEFLKDVGFRLRVTGTAGTPFRLQHSSDLAQWKDAGSHVMGSGEMTLVHSSGSPREFYRLKW